MLKYRHASGKLERHPGLIQVQNAQRAKAANLTTAIAVILFLAMVVNPTLVRARDSVVGFLCEETNRRANWFFSVDFENGAVIADIPVNWASVTQAEVLFVHAVFANGRQYLTQQYTLDRQSGRLETCDYASADQMPSPCEAKLTCRPNSLRYDYAF